MKLTSQTVQLDGNSLTIQQVSMIASSFARVEITPSALEKVRKGRESVERLLDSGRTVYGINTGFGKLAEVKIKSSELDELQVNLIRSHSVGTGDPLSETEVRAVMTVRLNSLLKGNSGVRPAVVQRIANFLNRRVFPEVPRYGSLGASGDLAPSAHLALTLMGEGFVLVKGRRVRSESILKRLRIEPLELKAKEGLAIINGTQVMTGFGSLVIRDSSALLYSLDVAAALSLEALEGNTSPFESRIHMLRQHHGQQHVAARILSLVRDSSLLDTGKRLQDPYSLRCIPQVHGAFLDSIEYARKIVEVEINSVTDNPIIFPESDTVVSGGNFHGQPVALALDLVGISLAEAGVISERRIDKLLSGFNPRLPLFLTRNSGLQSGLMVSQYTAAALVAENRILAGPASLDNATVSAGQEDHASMGVTSALKARRILDNTLKIIAIEMICASQAIDLLQHGRLGQGTSIAYNEIRKIVKTLTADRPLADELNALTDALAQQRIVRALERTVQL